MSEKIPTPIVDKNGKQTTVHKNVDVVPALRLQGIHPFVITRTPEEVHAKQMNFIADLSHDLRVIFPGTDVVEIGTDINDDAKINNTLRYDGTVTEFNPVLDSLSMSINRSLRNVDYRTGMDLGYIKLMEPNSRRSLYLIDLNDVDRVITEQAL